MLDASPCNTSCFFTQQQPHLVIYPRVLFFCFLAGLAGQVDVVCSVEPQQPHDGFLGGSNTNPVLYLFDLGHPYFFVIGGSPISAPATCEPEKSKQFQVARSNTHKLLEQGVQVAARLNEQKLLGARKYKLLNSVKTIHTIRLL